MKTKRYTTHKTAQLLIFRGMVDAHSTAYWHTFMAIKLNKTGGSYVCTNVDQSWSRIKQTTN